MLTRIPFFPAVIKRGEKCGSTGSIGAGNLYVPAGNLFDLIHLLIKLKFDGVKKSVVLFFPE